MAVKQGTKLDLKEIIMKNVIALMLVAFSGATFAHGAGCGSAGGGTGAQPVSQAQVVLRAGYEACKTSADKAACMAPVYKKVTEENRKANRF